jgi:hypothetical protein
VKKVFQHKNIMLACDESTILDGQWSPKLGVFVDVSWVPHVSLLSSPIMIDQHKRTPSVFLHHHVRVAKIAMDHVALMELGDSGTNFLLKFLRAIICFRHRYPLFIQKLHDDHMPTTGKVLECDQLWCKTSVSTPNVHILSISADKLDTDALISVSYLADEK